MVQSIENWAKIKGKIVDIAKHDDLDDYVTATVAVDDVTPVDDYANLFSWAKDKEITVNIPAEKARELSLERGHDIQARVRKAGPKASFVQPESLKNVTESTGKKEQQGKE